MKDWRELFSDDALVEGWELYLDGRVENLEVFDEDGKFYELSATVYEELEGDLVAQMMRRIERSMHKVRRAEREAVKE